MHPFFKPVLTKANRSLSEQQIDQLDEPLALGAVESLPYNYQHNDTEFGSRRDESNASGEQNPNEHRQEQGESENIDVDPNSERKKRRKTKLFEKGETTSSQRGAEGAPDGGGSWLAQLQAAATSGSAELQGQQDVDAETMLTPRTPLSASPVKLAIRKSPIKTPGKPQLIPDTPAETPPSALRPSTRSSSSSGSKRAPSPGLGPTPMRKVIRLTSKGKLLSSPPSVSPAAKRKTRSKNTKITGTTAPELRMSTRLCYGTDDESRTLIGNQINAILSQRVTTTSHDQARPSVPPRTTHPFFLGKAAKKAKSEVIVLDDNSVTGQDSDADEKLENGGGVKPKRWKDLGFEKNQASTAKVVDAIRTLWPPKDMQHLGVATLLPILQHDYQTSIIRRKSSKSRIEPSSVSVDQDILQKFAATLEYHPTQLCDAFPLPQTMVLSRQQMMNTVKENLSSSPGIPPGSSALQDAHPEAFERMQSRLLSNTSSSDAYVAGIAHSWLSNSAPQQTSQVLQNQSAVLRKWLASHQIYHTATKFSAVQKVKTARKRRRKKKAEDLDDFITNSDEGEELSTTAKNAILITGPSGCGKTASVYAAAKELNFEVFEIHPGMRRSAKDIFDKVGDMTQNHLVHKAVQLDRARDSTPDASVIRDPSSDNVEGGKNALKSFLGNKQSTLKKETSSKSRPATPKDEVGVKTQNQKQSLILFEEVDILFEEDRGFWSGVIQLIEQSKRPAVLTCNDATSVPVENLPLHATLEYEQVPVNVAVDYILLLAATEGHCLQREAIHLLYLTMQKDLRATISELNFWCQMAVGSEKAGLDWTIEPRSSDEDLKSDGERLKLFSKDTYLSGMGLVPRTLISPDPSKQGALLQYVEDELSIPLQDWHDERDGRQHPETTARQSSEESTIHLMQQHLDLSETRSTLDLLDQPVDAYSDVERMHQAAISAEIAAATLNVFTPQAASVSVAEIMLAHLKIKAAMSEPLSNTLPTAFEPLMAEKPQFPPSLGRLAPSLETSSSYLMTDIAPYIRSIVRYDQRLEVQRDAIAGGSQGIKTRKTRAARAALEGGSKASTREEKWFPKRTDYAALLQLGGSWPLWVDEATRPGSGESSRGTESRTESTATSPAADVEMIDEA